jgi:hypothetical protein
MLQPGPDRANLGASEHDLFQRVRKPTAVELSPQSLHLERQLLDGAGSAGARDHLSMLVHDILRSGLLSCY